MKMKKFHPFHILDNSPWPVVCSLCLLLSALSALLWMNKKIGLPQFLLFGFLPLLLSATQWWRDVVRESTLLGFHTKEVCKGLYLGFSMFILSEVMFFFSFFFGYFFSSLNPDVSLGGEWPPVGVQPVSFMGVPLSNTVILLSSGVSITWAHHSMIESNKKEFLMGMTATVALAILFMGFQWVEYFEVSFTFSDSVYGSLFFLMTGFHGLHVMAGLLFLSVSFFRGVMEHFSPSHHLGFEFSAWYWHFVDVVWLFLFIVVYWWGS